MNIRLTTKLFVSVILATIGISVFASSYLQNAIAQAQELTMGQNASSTNNQTGSALQQQSAAAKANLTSTDFGSVMSSLLEARQGVLNNNSVSAYNAINAVESQLFQLLQTGSGNNEALGKQLTGELEPLHKSIDNARAALKDSNSTEALRWLNGADNRILIILQQLPSGSGEAEEAEG